jgi:HlyD family secretion protein
VKKRMPLILVALAVTAFAVWKISKSREFLYAGTVEATYVDISPQLTTPIATVEVREGNPVKSGQVLVTLSAEDVRLAAQIAQRDYARAVKLRESGTLPEEQFDKLRFKRDDAALRDSWRTIVSPIDGTVIDRYREPGEMVNPSMKLLTLADLKNLWAYIYVPQSVMSKLQLNQEIAVTVPELDLRKFTGRVSYIRPEAEFTPKNVQTREERTRLVFGVKIAFDNTDAALKPGMTVEADLAGR